MNFGEGGGGETMPKISCQGHVTKLLILKMYLYELCQLFSNSNALNGPVDIVYF
jgi:hypothetical protein